MSEKEGSRRSKSQIKDGKPRKRGKTSLASLRGKARKEDTASNNNKVQINRYYLGNIAADRKRDGELS